MNILDLKRKLLPMSGPQGGGGSSPTSTTTGGLPDWAQGYAQETLAKQSALSDRPYQAYQGNRIQGFSPLQEQAKQSAVSMDAGPEGFSKGISAYMNPYMQNVVDIQKREAQRQSGIQGVAQAGQATSSGALGGSRDAIMRAERERNLGQQMGDIQAQGSNAAYNQAANQFRQGITQGMDVNRLQAGYGAQEQALGQQGLNMAYQDFQNQQQYPQQQLSNMASMMRGLPITQQTTTGTPGSPSNLQMLGSIGSTAYGLSQFLAEGGEVSSFAGGGGVDSNENVEKIVHQLSDQELALAEQAARVRGDVAQLKAIDMEKAARASLKKGIGAAPVDMDMMLPTEESMARGGIVAFDEGGWNTGEDEAQDYMDKPEEEADTEIAGDPKTIAGSINALQGMKYKAPTPEERLAEFKANRALLTEGVDNTDREGIRADIKRMQDEGASDVKRGRGLAAIQAGAAMLQGNDPMRGLAAGASTFSEAYGGAIKASQAKNQALQNMKLNLAESQRKEQMGLNREAVALQDQARKDRDAAQKFEVDRLRSLGILQGNAARAARGAAAKPPAALKLAEQLGEAEVNAAMNPDDKTAQTKVKALRSAVSQAKSSFSVADIGGNRMAEGAAERSRKEAEDAAKLSQAAQLKRETDAKEARRAATESMLMDKETRKLKGPAKEAEIQRRVNETLGSGAAAAAALPSPIAPKAPKATAIPSIAAVAGAPKGSKIGKLIPGKGHQVLDSSGQLIGYAQ